MPRRAALILIMLCATFWPAAALDYRRESMWIPHSGTGPRGLEAVLVRPPTVAAIRSRC